MKLGPDILCHSLRYGVLFLFLRENEKKKKKEKKKHFTMTSA